MSSVSSPKMVVEHVMLIQLKNNAAPEKISAMETAILSLNSLPTVDNLSVSPLTYFAVSSSDGENLQDIPKFTHALHGRFANKQALAEYSPILLKAVLPVITSDILSVDWEAQPDGHDTSTASSYGALRIQLHVPKADLDEASKAELTEAIKRYKDVGQVSFGDNFSPRIAYGFSLGILILFEGVEEMENLTQDEQKEHGFIQKGVTSYVDKSLVIQYALNPPYHA